MRLCKTVEDECNFLTCKKQQCSLRLKSMVKLYMKVRIFHVPNNAMHRTQKIKMENTTERCLSLAICK